MKIAAEEAMVKGANPELQMPVFSVTWSRIS
jgi:hypothetical protein